MIESAIYFPIAIFCSMAVLALLLNLYMQTSAQAYLHLLLREEANAYGGRTEVRFTELYERDRYRRDAESLSLSATETGGPFHKSLEVSFLKTYYGGRFTNPFGYETEYAARCYIIDEAGLVRLRNLAPGG